MIHSLVHLSQTAGALASLLGRKCRIGSNSILVNPRARTCKVGLAPLTSKHIGCVTRACHARRVNRTVSVEELAADTVAE